jgi:hypothetical protein
VCLSYRQQKEKIWKFSVIAGGGRKNFQSTPAVYKKFFIFQLPLAVNKISKVFSRRRGERHQLWKNKHDVNIGMFTEKNNVLKVIN